jgi:plastocyanin
MVRTLFSLALLGALTGAGAEHTVTQKGKRFSAATLEIKAGQAVTFTNDDDVTHNVFSTSAGQKFNLKTQAPGASSTHTFTAKGTAEVRCAFHPTMKLTITVD